MTPDPQDEVFAKAFAEAFARSLDEVEGRCLPPMVAPVYVKYADWWSDLLRAELRRVRLAQAATAQALAVPGVFTDQTLLNIESGKHSPTLRTFVSVCERLGIPFEEVVFAAIRRQ